MTFTDSSVVLSQNQPWLMESQPVWNLLKSGTAGHPHHSFECCSSMMWCRQARYRRSLSNFCSKRMQAPAWCPVFDDVVSKHMALTRSATLQPCNRVYTAAAVFSPVPLVSSAVLRHRPARAGPRAPAEQGALLRKKYIF